MERRGAEQGHAVCGAGKFGLAAQKGGDMHDLGGNSAFAGACRPQQNNAACFFECDWCGLNAPGQSRRKRGFRIALRHIAVVQQIFDQLFWQAVAL